MDATSKRRVRIVLVALACVAMYGIYVQYEARFFGSVSRASMAHPHTGFLLLVAMFARDPWVLRGAVIANGTAWLNRSLPAPAILPVVLAACVVMLATYGILRLSALLMRFPRPLQGRHLLVSDLPRFVVVAAIGLPAAFSFVSVAVELGFSDVPMIRLANDAAQTFFAKQFGVLIVTLPLLVALTHRPLADRSGNWLVDVLPWRWLLIGIALPYAVITFLRAYPQWFAGWETLLLNQRLFICAVLIAACLLLSLRWSMPLLSLTLFLLVAAMTHAAERSVALPDVWALAGVAGELILLQSLVVVLLLASREREQGLRRAQRFGAALRSLNQILDAKVVARTRELSERQEELRAANAHLNTALADLQQAQRGLIEAEKMASQGRLVAGVAHEINTPLSVGITGLSFIRDELSALHSRIARSMGKERADATLANAFEACTMVERNLTRVAELIRSFKQTAVDASESSVRAGDLGDLLRESVEVLGPGVERAGHRLELACPPGIRWVSRPDALHELLVLLVDNALSHAFRPGESGCISLSVSVDASRIRLVIADDGVGIPADVAAHVFDAFFTTRRHAGGTGLGLHIAYNLAAQALGGRLTLLPSERGARFELDLPRRHPDATAAFD